MKFKFTLLNLLLLFSQFSFELDIFESGLAKKKVDATNIENNLKIDGKLDEPELLTARIIKDFIEPDSNQAEPVKNES